MPTKKITTEQQEILLAKKALASFVFLVDDYMATLTDGEKNDVGAFTNQVFSNAIFSKLMDDLSREQTMIIATEATHDNLSFCRGTLNGINMVFDKFEKLANEYKAAHTPEEKYDKFSAT